MKIIIKFIIFITLISYYNIGNADINIAYLDMNKIFNESTAGKQVLEELEKIKKNNMSKFKKNEDLLKKEENEIASQKNILSNEEYEKKVQSFREKVDQYNLNKYKSIKDLNDKRNQAINILSKSVNDILIEFSEKKKISLIIPKENIIIGKSEFDLTNEILIIVEKKIKKINFD